MLITFKMRWLLYINLQLFIALVVNYLISYDYSPLEYGFGLIGPDGNFEYSGFTLYLLLLIVTNLVGVVCKLRGHWSAEVLWADLFSRSCIIVICLILSVQLI